jgi:exonuclease SbcD
MDLHANFARAAQWAIEHEASLFCVLGDLFDRTHVAPIFRELVRRDVIEPLGRAGIEVWILAGNHDQPRRSVRGTSLDDFRGYAHVRVFREPKAEMREIDGRRIGFIILPYMHPDQVVAEIHEKLGREVPREEAYETARRIWKGWIENRAQDLKDADLRILLGHFETEGVRYTGTTPPEVVPHDFTFSADMLPPSVDLAVFGHIHMHQFLHGKLVYAGAPERIDWGERLDPKGFLSIGPDGSWTFQELPARPMLKIDVRATLGDDVTQKILDALPPDRKSALVRIEVTLPDEMRTQLDDRRLGEALADVFHYELKFVSADRPRIVTDEFVLDPTRLLGDYIDKALSDHPKKEAIKSEAERILREAVA